MAAEGGPKAENELAGLVPDGLVAFGIGALPVVPWPKGLPVELKMEAMGFEDMVVATEEVEEVDVGEVAGLRRLPYRP